MKLWRFMLCAIPAALCLYSCGGLVSVSGTADTTINILDPRRDFLVRLENIPVYGAGVLIGVNDEKLLLIGKSSILRIDGSGTIEKTYTADTAALEIYSTPSPALWNAYFVDEAADVLLMYNHHSGQKLYLFGSSEKVLAKSIQNRLYGNRDYYFSLDLSPYGNAATCHIGLDGTQNSTVYQGDVPFGVLATPEAALAACVNVERTHIFILTCALTTASVTGSSGSDKTYMLYGFDFVPAVSAAASLTPVSISGPMLVRDLDSALTEWGISVSETTLVISCSTHSVESGSDSSSDSGTAIAFNRTTGELLGQVSAPLGRISAGKTRAYTFGSDGNARIQLISAIRWGL